MTTELHAGENDRLIAKPTNFGLLNEREKFATLRKNEDNRFVMSNEEGIKIYDTKESLTDNLAKISLLLKLLKK
jgi:cell division GTPase FtsZ